MLPVSGWGLLPGRHPEMSVHTSRCPAGNRRSGNCGEQKVPLLVEGAPPLLLLPVCSQALPTPSAQLRVGVGGMFPEFGEGGSSWGCG